MHAVIMCSDDIIATGKTLQIEVIFLFDFLPTKPGNSHTKISKSNDISYITIHNRPNLHKKIDKYKLLLDLLQ